MGVYSKSVSQLSTQDLETLLAEGPVENVRLEFKADAPSREEFLKKMVGFANTYGGLLVVGASASSKDGKLTALPGIERLDNYKQTLVQWSFSGATPPVEIAVSDPIPAPGQPQSVCYVVSVPESLVAPHFINGRKGAYVRTDEYSGRFEPQLATNEELLHLNNRRALAVQRRSDLLARAQLRAKQLGYDHHHQGAVLSLFACPAFPSRTILDQDRLYPLLQESGGRCRSMGFPMIHKPVSQHETMVLLEPASESTYMEATSWGSLFYAASVRTSLEGKAAIHLFRLMGMTLLFLAHAGRYYEKAGFDGLLWYHATLTGVQGLPLYAGQERSGGSGSPLDDAVAFELLDSSDRLKSSVNDVARDISRTLFYALNWHDATSRDDSLRALLDMGYEYNAWKVRTF